VELKLSEKKSQKKANEDLPDIFILNWFFRRVVSVVDNKQAI
jgi:hypothetical protein